MFISLASRHVHGEIINMCLTKISPEKSWIQRAVLPFQGWVMGADANGDNSRCAKTDDCCGLADL
jgi:hypothetical protein